jgi:hypothetical protein
MSQSRLPLFFRHKYGNIFKNMYVDRYPHDDLNLPNIVRTAHAVDEAFNWNRWKVFSVMIFCSILNNFIYIVPSRPFFADRDPNLIQMEPFLSLLWREIFRKMV